MHLREILEADNLVPALSDSVRGEITEQILNQYNADHDSMDEWFDHYDKALKLASMDSSDVEKDRPFRGAARVMMPYVLEAAIDFNARVVTEVLGRKDPVSVEMLGSTAGQMGQGKNERAGRVQNYMNAELKKNMDWDRRTDREMMALPVVGTSYKKYWYDPVLGQFRCSMVPADKVIFSQEVECFEDAEQCVHEVPYTYNEIVSHEKADIWDVDLERLDEKQEQFDLCEAYFTYDLDGDGYAEPYIAMLEKESKQLVRMVANFDEEDIIYDSPDAEFDGYGRQRKSGEVVAIERMNYITQKQLMPDPNGSPMGMGFGILLSDIFDSINTTVRQLLDAGTLANYAGNSGFIADGVTPRGGASRADGGHMEMEMGRFKRMHTTQGRSLKDSIVQMPVSGPNQTTFELMQHLVDTARGLVTTSYNVEANSQEAASLYLARLQQNLKRPNAMMWRVFRGMQEEFRCFMKLIYKYGDQEYYLNLIDEQGDIKADFNPDDCDVTPTMNPAHGSDVERMAQASAALEQAREAPQVHNLHEAYRRYYEAMGIENVEALLPPPQPGPNFQQKLEMQYAAKEAERQERELAIKERDQALKQMEQARKARQEMAELQLEAQKVDGDRKEKIAHAIERLAQVADQEERRAMEFLNQELTGAQDGADSAGQPGGGREMAAGPGNAGVSGGPERV